ncbi:MAG: Bax inhibitor-1/YccA family protein [Flavobacteriales bacterium]|nr:Bax inhibitor-1/YccA family protein [Flavobacteriales bacterium]
MENNTYPANPSGTFVHAPVATDLRSFLSNVFTYMAVALILSGVVAWWFANDASLLQYLVNFETGKQTILGWVVLFAPLGLVLLMGAMLERLSATALLAVYVVYSIVTGMSLSFIFLAYTASSITNVFFFSAAVFAVMAVAGYTTKTDLTKLGNILMIGLIGIVIASLINMFLGSSTMDYIISIIGVVVFTGLTAYDMQKLKVMGSSIPAGTEQARKMALMGALNLYLDFINLFLMLLRLFGSRRD